MKLGWKMEELKRDIEQLDEAGRQLSKSTPTGARLALFLMDNLAELMMYRTVSLWLRMDKEWHRPPKYSSEKRRKVIEYFNEKVNFLTNETQKLSQPEGNILKLGHRLRNEAYHKGIIRESIIIPVASIYFEVVCSLHPRMWVGHYTHPPNQNEIPSFFGKYGLEVNHSLIDSILLAKLSDKFLEGKRCPVPKLSEALSMDLERRIEGTLRDLEYVAENPRTAEDVLKHIQFYDHFWSGHSFPQTEEGTRRFFETWEREYAQYSPPVTIAKIRRWKERAMAIKSETNLGLIIQKFDQLDREFLPVEEKVIEAAVAYDMDIDREVTRMKEERS